MITKQINYRVLYVLALSAVLSSRSLAQENDFRIVEDIKKSPQIDKSFHLKGKLVQLIINAEIKVDPTRKFVNSQISYIVGLPNDVKWEDSLKGKYNISISNSNGKIEFSNYISTTSKSNVGWTVMTRHIVRKSEVSKGDLLSFWAIITNRSTDDSDQIAPPSKYDVDKPYQIFDSKRGTVILINLGNIHATNQ